MIYPISDEAVSQMQAAYRLTGHPWLLDQRRWYVIKGAQRFGPFETEKEAIAHVL